MVNMTLKQRLAELEAKAKTPSQQAEVIAILRQRLADPETPEHRKDMIRCVLAASRPLTFSEAKETGVIDIQMEALYA